MKKVKRKILIVLILLIISIAFGAYWFNREFDVVFINSDNSIIDRRTVKYGKSIDDVFSPIVQEGYKFVSWDKSIKNIRRDTIVKAIVEEINNGENVISLGNSYGELNSEVSIPLIIDGNVDICALDLNIEYDSNYLTCTKSINEDSGVLTNVNDDSIYVSFSSANNTTSTIYLCDLIFKVNKNIDDSKLLQIKVNNCKKYLEDKIIETNYSTIDGLISNIS